MGQALPNDDGFKRAYLDQSHGKLAMKRPLRVGIALVRFSE